MDARTTACNLAKMQRTPPELRALARALRNNPTPAERRLWQTLQHHRPRFTRQLLVSHYILDLACRSLKLGIELDGGHHGSQLAKDAARTGYLQRQGWQVLRFWNNEVIDNTDGVVRAILDAVAARS